MKRGCRMKLAMPTSKAGPVRKSPVALPECRNAGMLNLLFYRETLEILGIYCFGDPAAKIVHIGQAIMAQKGETNTIQSIQYVVKTT